MYRLCILVLTVALMVVVGPQMSAAQRKLSAAQLEPAEREIVAPVEPIFLDGVTKQSIDASRIAEPEGETEVENEDAVLAMASADKTKLAISRRYIPCQMHKFKQTVYRNGCKGVVTSHRCYGQCWSYSYLFVTSGTSNKYEYQYCKCCRSNFNGAVSMYFPFRCPNGQTWYYPYTVVRSCSCQTCGRYPGISGPY